MPVLSVRNLSKAYGDIIAVHSISFSVQKGEIVGLLGPNGAGKTSTISMILGILEPSEGGVFIGGFDLGAHRPDALERTNFAAVYAQLPGNLTVYQNLKFFGLLYGVPDLEEGIKEVTSRVNLDIFLNTKCGLLSSGEQTRVGLAKALLNTPTLLLLDEPTASLDPSAAAGVRECIMQYASLGEGGVLWTSHNMQEVELVCDRVLFLSHGKVLLEGNPKRFQRSIERRIWKSCSLRLRESRSH